MKKGKNNAKQTDNLSVNATFDDIIGLSMGQPIKPKVQKQQNVTPKKKGKK
jgi:hypothetical protein